MSEKISEYITSVTALASGDLMDVSKLISTSPLDYQSQKLNYSVLLTELNADLSITLQSAYNASTQPQILTSIAKGGVVIRSGQALDTNSVLELKNIAGSSTFVVGGNGVVATGNWQGTAIAAAFGGTGQTSYAVGDIVYASNTTAIAKLGIGTSGQVLTVSGGGLPSWATISAPNLGSANLTSTDDARTFTLKTGTTATQNFQILNSASQIGYYFDGTGSVAIGTTTTSGKLTIKGSGSTSATTTALFQNSSSITSLEIKDDLTVSTFNNGGYATSKFTNKGAIIGGNFNGSTTSDPNNVLGGSYANGVIIGGYNNTHNGYLGVVSGGSNSVSGAVSFVFSFGSTSTNNYNAILGGASHTASGAYSAVIGGQSNTASGEGAVAVGGNQAIASGYRSFAQGYGSYASAHYAVTFGSYSSASARSARAVGEYCVASGVSSWASGLGTLYGGTGQDLRASGLVSFNHSYNDATVLYRAAEGDYSVILGGKNHWSKSGSTSSAIIGGEGNTINASVVRSVILGGSAITATASDTVYTPNLNVTADVVFSQSTNSTATGANARITSHPTSTIVLTNASLTSIGSIVAGLAGGHIVTLMNETGASITIVDAYGSAAAGEVIYTNTASNLTIRNNCGATFQYNATGACWTKI